MKKKHPKRMSGNNSIALLITASIILAVFRIYLACTAGYHFLGDSIFDDFLQISQAKEIANGNWLGAYGATTLTKSVSFPLFAAFFYKRHLPLSLGFGLFAVLAALVFVLTFRGRIPRIPLFIGYVWVLFSTSGFGERITLRLYRNSVCMYAVMILVLLGIGLFMRLSDKENPFIFVWALAYGLSVAFFWNLREDSIWLAPLIGAVSLFCIIRGLFIRKRLAICLISALLPLAVLAGSISLVKLENQRHYGVFLANDRTQGAFATTMSLLYQINDPLNSDPDIWMTRSMVRQACDVSPMLNRIRPEIFDAWDRWSGKDEERIGDFGQWIIRDAADRAGLFVNAQSFQDFFLTVNKELNAAFNSEILVKGDGFSLSAQANAFTFSDIKKALPQSLKNTFHIINQTYSKVSYPAYAIGDVENVALMEEVTGIPAIYLPESGLKSSPDKAFSILGKLTATVTNILVWVNRIINWVSLAAAAALWVIYIIAMLGRKLPKERCLAWVIATGILLNAFAGVLIVTIFCNFRVEPYFHYFYLCGTWPLFQLFQMAGAYAMAQGLLPKSLKNVF